MLVSTQQQQIRYVTAMSLSLSPHYHLISCPLPCPPLLILATDVYLTTCVPHKLKTRLTFIFFLSNQVRHDRQDLDPGRRLPPGRPAAAAAGVAPPRDLRQAAGLLHRVHLSAHHGRRLRGPAVHLLGRLPGGAAAGLAPRDGQQ